MLPKEFVSSVSQVLQHRYEWPEYYVGFENNIREKMMRRPNPKVLIDLSFMTSDLKNQNAYCWKRTSRCRGDT